MLAQTRCRRRLSGWLGRLSGPRGASHRRRRQRPDRWNPQATQALESRLLLTETLLVESFTGQSTVSDWGLTESYLSETRGLLQDPLNFGAAGQVDVEFVIGAGIDTQSLPEFDRGAALADTLANADIFFTGLSINLTTGERDAIFDFVNSGGSLIATTDAASVNVADLFGVVHGSPLSTSAVSAITDTAHPIASGPFGSVSTFTQYGSIGSYNDVGSTAQAIATNQAGTSLAVIDSDALSPGSGRVVLITDTDVFSNDGVFSNGPGGGVAENSTLIRNLFAWAGDSNSGLSETEVSLDAAGNLLVTDAGGGDSDDNLILTADAVNAEYVITDLNHRLFTNIPGVSPFFGTSIRVPFSAVTGSQIIVNTLAGDDTLTILLSEGDLGKQVLFHGGSQATPNGDALILLDAPGTQRNLVTHHFDGSDSTGTGTGFDGSIDVDGQTITYTGLEPIDDNLSAVSRVFQFGDPADVITLEDDGDLENGLLRISSAGTSETVVFANPSDSLTILGGTGDDVIEVLGLDDSFDAQLTVDGEAGADVVDIDVVELNTGPLIRGSSPDVLFVVDVSGSAGVPNNFPGAGDVNGDGRFNSILDGELLSFIALNNDLVDRGLDGIAEVGIVQFATNAAQVDVNPLEAGLQQAASPAADADGNLRFDIEDALRLVQVAEPGANQTSYEAALQAAISFFTAQQTPFGQGSIVFLSDGRPNVPSQNPNEFADEVTTLINDMGVRLRAFGVGNNAYLPALQSMDPDALVILDPDRLLEILGGVDRRQITVADSGSEVEADEVILHSAGEADRYRVVPGMVEMTLPYRYQVSHSGVESLTISSGEGDDSVDVDPAGVPVGGLTFHGGGPGDFDSLDISTGSFETAAYHFTSATDGSIALADGATTATITYTGLEPITDSTVVATRSFTYSGADDTVVLSDDGVADDGFSFIDSDFAEEVTFRNPTAELLVDGGNGSDLIRISGLDSLFDASLTIGSLADTEIVAFETTETSAGSGDVIVQATTSIDVGAAVFSNGGAISLVAVESISGTGTLDTNGGAITLTSINGGVTAGHLFSGSNASGGAVTVQAGTSLTAGRIHTVGSSESGDVTLNAGGDILVEDIITSGLVPGANAGDVSVTSAGGSFTTTGPWGVHAHSTYAVGGNISIDVDQSVTISEQLWSRGGTDSSDDQGGNVEVFAAHGNILVNQSIRTDAGLGGPGNVSLIADGDIQVVSEIDSSSSSSGGEISVESASGNILLGGADPSGGSGPGGSIGIQAHGDVTLIGQMRSSSQLTAGNFSITSVAGNIQTADLYTSGSGDGGNVSLTAAGTVTTALIWTVGEGQSGGVTIEAGGDILVEDIVTPGIFPGSDAGDVSVTSATGAFSTDGVWGIHAQSVSGSAGNIVVTAALGVDIVGNLRAHTSSADPADHGGQIDVSTSSGGISVTQVVRSYASAGSGGNIRFDAAGDIVVGQGIAAYGGSAGGDALVVSSSGNIAVDQINTSASQGPGGDISVEALGNVTLEASAESQSEQSDAGDISIRSATGAIQTNDLLTNSTTANGGNVSLIAAGTVTTALVWTIGEVQSGSVTIEAGGDILVEDIVTPGIFPGSDAGDVSVTSATGAFSTDGIWGIHAHSVTGSAGNIVVTAALGVNIVGNLRAHTSSADPADHGGQIDVSTSSGGISVTQVVRSYASAGSGGNIRFDAAGDIVVGQGIAAYGGSAGGDALVVSSSGNIAVDQINTSGVLETGGDIRVSTASGYMSLNRITAIGTNAGGNVTLDGAGAVTDVIDTNGDVTKTGNGTMTFSAENSYTGDTHVEDGTLALVHSSNNNIVASSRITTLAGAVLDVTGLNGGLLQLADGQLLSGDGQVNGDVQALTGSGLAPGLSPGVLAVTGALSFDDSSTTAIEVGGNTPGSGAGFHDQLVVHGTLAISELALLQASAFDDGSGQPYEPGIGDELIIIRNESLTPIVLGAGGAGFNGLLEGRIFSTDFLGQGLIATITYEGGDGNDVVLKLNTPPTADAGGPYAVAEGGSVVLDASGSSDFEQTLESLTFAWDLDGDGLFGETGAAAERGDEVGIAPVLDAAGLDGPDTLTVGLRVTDAGGLSHTDTATIVISNVAPQIESLTASAATMLTRSEDGVVTLNGSFSDVGLPDTHSVTIDWGDGTAPESATVDQINDRFSSSHEYQTGGIYVVSVTVTDDDNGMVSATTTSVVTGIGVVDGTLFIIGTDDRDHIVIRHHARHDELTINAKLGQGRNRCHGHRDGDHVRLSVPADDVRKIVAFLFDGDDHYDGNLGDNSEHDRRRRSCGRSGPAIPQIVFGGEGDDHLTTGDAADVVFGQGGRDQIRGSGGGDILVGGTGRDQVRGGQGNDLLIGGAIDRDFSDPAILDEIDAAMAEWAEGHLAETLQLLGTVIDDRERDDLFGDGGQDEFVTGLFDRVHR